MNIKRVFRFGFVSLLAISLITVLSILSFDLALGASSSSEEISTPSQDLEITRDPATGAVRFLRSRRGLDSGADRQSLTASPSGAVSNFLARYEDLLGMPNAQHELVFQERKVDEIGMVHVRLQQFHQGVLVHGAEVIVHYAPDGTTVRVVNGRFIPNLAILPQPTIDSDAAVAAVRAVQPGGELWEEPVLRIYSGHIDPAVTGDHLAWLVRIFDEDEPSRNLYVVDAQTGAILTSYNELDTARNRRIHDAEHGTSLPGRLLRVEGGAPVPVEDANEAYDFLGDTYDYFNSFGRDSYDGGGARLQATVHYGTNYRNAFWNGQQMVFGDLFTVDDVTAHELTHAVTEYSAGLIYRYESGALNESYSDIFGEIVDQINGQGTDTEGVAWLMGEDLPIGAIRDMADPPDFGDPDRVSNYVCTSSDNGGVHTNSGIPNKAAYLMTLGIGDGTITRIALLKMGQVQYRALTTYLTPSSSFVDDYQALNQACQDLIAPDGITPGDCDRVKEALLAVEMNTAPVCGGDGGWETAYVDLFESQADLDILREYRDEFLMKTRKGRLYTRLLYKYSEEALKVFLANPELMSEAAHLITENREAVSDVLAGHEGVIYNSREISSFLKAFAERSPRSLRFWTNIIRWEIRMKQRWGRPFLGFMLE